MALLELNLAAKPKAPPPGTIADVGDVAPIKLQVGKFYIIHDGRRVVIDKKEGEKFLLKEAGASVHNPGLCYVREDGIPDEFKILGAMSFKKYCVVREWISDLHDAWCEGQIIWRLKSWGPSKVASRKSVVQYLKEMANVGQVLGFIDADDYWKKQIATEGVKLALNAHELVEQHE